MLISFAQAITRILDAAPSHLSIQTEDISLIDALGRITALPIISPSNVPSFDNSAMDGYALCAADLGENQTLPISNTILAGDKPNQPLSPKTCVKIMTGAPIPSGADTVVMQEDTECDGKQVIFTKPIRQNSHIRRIGEDVQKGTTVVPLRTQLTLPIISTLATSGIDKVTVFKPVIVAIFSTGNELTPIGQALPDDAHIYDSNRLTLQLMLKQLGCTVIDLGIVKDDPAKIQQTLMAASHQADLVITSGGVSVGVADHTKNVLTEIGTVDFWKIAMKPGKPFTFGHIGEALYCGLPGNPVSTLVTFYQLVRPLILVMSGLSIESVQNQSQQFKVKTKTKLKKSIGRVDFQRGILQVNHEGELEVISTGTQGSHITRSFNNANCFIVLEKERSNVEEGEWVTVEPFDSLLS